MKKPGKRWGCVLTGIVVQLPVLVLLIGQVLDMHNRFSILLSVVLPYAAIFDRLTRPPIAIGFAVVFITLVQYPLYGAIVGDSWVRGRLPLAAASLAAIHTIAGAIAIYMKIAKV
ncbi:MAG TPA: hypothetical protein VF456_04995 [Vicinamibacterales bacterium]